MNKKMVFVLLSSMFLITIISGTILKAYAGEPVFTGPVHLSGPAIVGSLQVLLTESLNEAGQRIDTVSLQIKGTCTGRPVSMHFEFPLSQLGITKEDFADIRAEDIENTNIKDMEGFVMYDSGPPDCYSDYGREILVINNVSEFNNTGSEITAEIVLLYVFQKDWN